VTFFQAVFQLLMHPPDLRDPVQAIEGLRQKSGAGATSVELQHEASRIRVKRAHNGTKASSR
jgi:hypothetical protein